MELIWEMDSKSSAEIKVYTRDGRLVKEWMEECLIGTNIKEWDLKNGSEFIGAGVYYVTIKTDKWVRKLMLCIVK